MLFTTFIPEAIKRLLIAIQVGMASTLFLKRRAVPIVKHFGGGGVELFCGTALFPNEKYHVVDIGANRGWFTFLTSILVSSNGHVYSFEPEPKNFKILSNVCRLNRLRNVTTFRLALSNKDGFENFYLSNLPSMHSLIERKGARSIKVQVARLDSIFKLGLIKQIDLIKIDVEGAELAVLNGSKNILKFSEPILSIDVNHYEGEFNEIKSFLEKINYKVFPLTMGIPGPYSIVACPLGKEHICKQLIIKTRKVGSFCFAKSMLYGKLLEQ